MFFLLSPIVFCFVSKNTPLNFFEYPTSKRIGILSSNKKPSSFSSSLSQSELIRKTLITNTKALASLFIVPKIVAAQDGAFELDAKYYINNLLGLAPNDGNERSQIIFPSPRLIDGIFATDVYNSIKREIISNAPNSNETYLNAYISSNISQELAYFQRQAPIVRQDLTDQYFFDVMVYILYTYAEKQILSSKDRVILRQRIGEKILSLIANKYSDPSNAALSAISSRRSGKVGDCSALPLVAAGVRLLLDTFSSKGLIGGYSIDDENFFEDDYCQVSFEQDLPVSMQITLKSPATLLGVLRQAASNTFFRPEIFATTIAAIVRSCGFGVRFEDYLMDNFYREDNFGVAAQDIIIEMEVFKKLV